MSLVELDRALRKLRLSGMANVLETRLHQAQSEKMAPLHVVSTLVWDELQRRQDRLFEHRTKQARFRDPERSLDSFDFDFRKKINRALVYEPATARSAAQRYGTRKDYFDDLATVPLLIIDDLGMGKLPHKAAEDLLKVVMRRYERVSAILTSNRPVDDRGKLLGDTAGVTALLDRLRHHGHVLQCGPRSWRTGLHSDLRSGGRLAVGLYPSRLRRGGQSCAVHKWPVHRCRPRRSLPATAAPATAERGMSASLVGAWRFPWPQLLSARNRKYGLPVVAQDVAHTGRESRHSRRRQRLG